MESKILSGTDFTGLPASYVYPESLRPNLSEVVESEDIPVIDLSCEDKTLLLKQIGDACREYGFFQVINHGVSKEAIEGIREVSLEFFNLPVEEKMKLYSDDPNKATRLSTSFNVRIETYNNWRDYLKLNTFPLEKFAPEWPSVPPSFKDIASRYCTEVRQLALSLEEAISESLGLDKDCLKSILGEQGQQMAINYYPACPQPELTLGLPGHADNAALTILLPDMQVPGLQIRKDGKWIAVKPIPDALVVNIADILQALTNDKYKSVLHRAIVNSEARLSIATFFLPCETVTIRAPDALKSPEDPYVYRDFTYAEFYQTFWNRKLKIARHLDSFKN